LRSTAALLFNQTAPPGVHRFYFEAVIAQPCAGSDRPTADAFGFPRSKRRGGSTARALELEMSYGKKIVLHCPNGLHRIIDPLVDEFIKSGVIFVGVVGRDAAKIEDLIDWHCVGDLEGNNSYYMLTSSHEDEALQEAIQFAEQLTGEYAGPVQVVEF
jgi:hypothetical protein